MYNRRFLPVFAALLLFLASFVSAAGRPGWTSKKVDLRVGDGRRIKAIHYPQGKEVHTRSEKPTRVRRHTQKIRRMEEENSKGEGSTGAELSAQAEETVLVNTIESPPVNGFIPWIAVSMTDERADEMDFYAYKETSVSNHFLPDDPQKDFAIGLYDTGAAAHVVGYRASQILSLGSDFQVDVEPIEISGVTGSVFAWVTAPLGVYMAGLNAIDTSTMNLDLTKLVGQSNVAVAVGNEPEPGAPDLPTAIGSPMSIFYTAVIKNDQPVSVHFEGKNYTSPHIEFYESKPSSEPQNPNIPNYPIKVPLELKPSGAAAVAYVPTIDMGSYDMIPSSPSVIIGNATQSLFFVHAVKLSNDPIIPVFEDFMIDTGAQVTVIGNQVAAWLELDTANPDFVVDIEGVNGQIVPIDGFYIDQITIPATGEWLTFTNIPVILLEVSSPEGGKLDGIIGMNLFNEYNMVIRGSGFFLQDDPTLELELITTPQTSVTGDIAPDPVDGVVDSLDMQVFMQAWLTSSGDADFNYLCDIAPESISDGKVDLLDLALMAANWLRDIN